MFSFPISYIEPVFRPPSEAQSLILPVTNGCSWNKCTFCEMYTEEQKKFRARKDEEIFATRVSWKNMVRDPDAVKGIHDARWVAQNIIKPLEAVQESSVLALVARSLRLTQRQRRQRPDSRPHKEGLPSSNPVCLPVTS